MYRTSIEHLSFDHPSIDVYISMDIYGCPWMSHPSKIENTPSPSPSHPRNYFSPIRSSGAGFAGICHNRSTPDNRNMRLGCPLIRFSQWEQSKIQLFPISCRLRRYLPQSQHPPHLEYAIVASYDFFNTRGQNIR